MSRLKLTAALALALAITSALAFGQAATAPKKAPAKKAPAAAKAPKTIAPADPRLKLTPPPPTLADGDTVVFLGDSITHQCLYTQYVENFFYTRHPKTKIRFHNAGVGGDRAADALARFDMDVAAYKPRVVTVLLGMNDGTYKQWDPAVFEAYERDMLKLLDRIQAIGAIPVVIGPTMFDREAMALKPRNDGKRTYENEAGRYYNAVLAYYGSFMREMAKERGLRFVDMFTPLNDLTLQERATNPNFTLIPDAIHPDANGQAVMANALVSALRTVKQVGTISAEAGEAGWSVKVSGGKAAEVSGDRERLTFTSHEPCIPWVLPEEAAIGYRITAAGHRTSNLTFRVQGLTPGRYELKVDGQPVGTFTHGQLAFKVELQNFPRLPQMQQALEVAALNKEKNELVVRPLRNAVTSIKSKRRAVEAGTLKQVDLDKHIEKVKAQVAELEQKKAEYEARIYAAAQPRPRKYEITKVTAN